VSLFTDQGCDVETHYLEAVNGGVNFRRLGEVIFPSCAAPAIRRVQVGRVGVSAGGRGAEAAR
jgi:hypothetical protein